MAPADGCAGALLYKAKNVRGNDELDSEAAPPSLDGEQKAWLMAGVDIVHPNHAWIERLKWR
jgi:hypothetical protein